MPERSGGLRKHKYNAIRSECSEGHSHPSRLEAKRCSELHILQRAGQIKNLEREVPFNVTINGKKIFTYRADFSYFTDTNRTIEDVKGYKTPVYRLKKKIVEAYFPGVKIVEVTR